MTATNREIERFIFECAKELEIEKPEFEFSLLEEAEGSLAKLIWDQEKRSHKLSLSEKYLVPFELYYQIAGELRRVWQRRYRPALLHGYREKGEVGAEAFHLQMAEVDANAYAAISVIEKFHATPLFEGFSLNVVTAIRHRIDEIADERDNPEYYEEDWED